MKKIILSLVLAMISVVAFAQQKAPDWTSILSDKPATFSTQLVSSSEKSIRVNVQVPGFYTISVTTPRGEAKVVTLPKALSTAQAGEPDMPMTGIPVMIGDKARMDVRVIDAEYIDFEGIDIAPSKGDFSRQIDPATVPYTYGECYDKDEFIPAKNLDIHEPYIIRDFRGQNMAVYPFAYNPVTKTLRVYYNMTVEMYKVDDNGTNAFTTRKSNTVKLDPDFKSIYQRHFINYEEASSKYTPIDENGDLLIICYDNFISNMTNFVNWKKTRGINTTIVGKSTAGSTYSAIKAYIQNQYNANNNITHVLLVGDVAQIPGYSYSGGGSNYSGLGDNPYGQIVGSDVYNDVIIGRFSASSAAQVNTQVNRTITYEKELTTSATWCQNGLGISASAGNGGHYNEDDYQHIENLRTDLLNYGYSTVYQDYKSVSGYPSSTTTTISNHINSGVGIINYCNHGEETGWQSHYYMNSHVNALTNNNKLPFIFSVACLVGKYDYSSGDCFAETWMHATNSNTPTGAIGGAFSYISQPWVPPMWAQDEFVDILVESYSNNIKRTFGGAAINSMISIFDHYSTSNSQAVGTYQAWIVYGDPTLMMRTKTPQAMTVNHTGTIAMGMTSYTVNVANGNGTVATITDTNHSILGKAMVNNGSATINISGTLTVNQELTLCVFGYNKVTYLGTITVVGGTQYTISASANPSSGGTVTGAGTYYEETECTLTATPNTDYAFVSWTKNGSVVSTNATYTFTVSEDASYIANFNYVKEYTVAIKPQSPEYGTVAFDSKNSRGEFVYDFEDGTSQGWTLLQGPNGDSPDNWMHCVDYTTENLVGKGHNESNGFVLSESYISDTDTGVTPDNYLVSPRMWLSGSITFWATNLSDEYGAEHFGVAVSTSGNTNANDFTTVEEWTLPSERTGVTRSLDDRVWYEYSVDLSGYQSYGYIAIRHFDCNYQWLLCVDDITIEVDDGSATATYIHGTSCTVTATPYEGYTFVKWIENDEVVSTEATYTFIVTDNRNLVANFAESTVTQTISLATGVNWVSFDVNITLNDLKAALMEALPSDDATVTIKSKQKSTRYQNGRWSGSFGELDMAHMYMIIVSDAFDITLEGTRVDLTELTVTISNGANWIAYPYNEGMSIADLFGSFSINNDQVKSKQQTARYNNGRWTGSLRTLNPGQGYIYISEYPDDRVFTFPINPNKEK